MTPVLGTKKLKLEITPVDIGRARCWNRRQCVIAQAMNRQLGLGGKGYIDVEATGAAYTYARLRYTYDLPRTALRYLRRFDETGKIRGEMEARMMLKPESFILVLKKVRKIAPKADRARMDQINRARNRRNAKARAAGVLPKTYARYVGNVKEDPPSARKIYGRSTSLRGHK